MSDTADHRSDVAPEPEKGDASGRSTPATVRDVASSSSPTAGRVRAAALLLVVALLALRYPVPVLIVAAFVFFIYMHELGHFLTARWAGMKVTEFFIGFGPRLWSFRRGEVEYGIKGIPAGAYVRIIGMSNLEEVDPAEEQRTYRQQPYWRRLSVAVAGSTMHFLIAIVLMFGLLVWVGTGDPGTEPAGWSVGTIVSLEGDDPSPAAKAGLEIGDRIVGVDGQRYATFEDLAQRLQQSPGEEVTLTVVRDGETFKAVADLAERVGEDGEPTGFLGVGPIYRRSPLTAAWESVTTTAWAIGMSVDAIISFFSPSGLSGYVETLAGATAEPVADDPEAGNRFVSPVGFVSIASQAADVGIAELLSLFVLVNVFIGVINLFPMLPFDGGHVVIATYERLRSRKGRRYFADVSKLMPVAYAVAIVFVVFIGLGSLYLDLVNPLQLEF